MTFAILDASVLQSACVDRIIGRKICILNEVSSTNDVALEWGELGEREGAVIFAESQTAGRGQLGRPWHSPAGCGIWCSVLLRPTFAARSAALLTPFAVMAVACAIYQTIGLKPSLKPPNDLYLAGGKVCGILTEARIGAQFFAVVGIGINVNQIEFPTILKGNATSLRKEVGYLCDRTRLALAVLSHLNRLYPYITDPKIQALYESWPQLAF